MKKYIIIIVVLLVIASLSAQNSLFTKGGTEYSIEEFPSVLDSMVKLIADSSQYNNLIIFVHGHGVHPQKAVYKRLPLLEKDYAAKVIVFHLLSWDENFVYPEKQAILAGRDLEKIFKYLKEFKEKNPQVYKDINPVLLTHSMGGYVLKACIEATDRDAYEGIFSSILINSPDVDTEDHYVWVDAISESDKIYITFNKFDPVLQSSAKAFNSKIRLGQKLESIFNGKYRLSQNAIYIDLSDIGMMHKGYMADSQYDNKYLQDFCCKVLNGKKVKFKKKFGFVKTDDKQVFRIKNDRKPIFSFMDDENNEESEKL